MEEFLTVKGAREHNLKNISLSVPRNKLIVFTGLSGSGKSSLAFDTIFAEGQRRYVESLSSYARQFLGQMDKPDVDFIEGLSPAVSIDQKSTNRNPRSTVGTVTEVYDYLRLLFARVGVPHCPSCGDKVSVQSCVQIVDQILQEEVGCKFLILAPVARGVKGEFLEVFAKLKASGYTRVRVDGVVYDLESVPALKKQVKHSIEVVVDRLVVNEASRHRIFDSVETALKLADGVVILEFLREGGSFEKMFSEHLACHKCGVSFAALEPRSFSFNSPFGACTVCTGIGVKLEVDVDLVIPDKELTLFEGAVAPWFLSPGAGVYASLLEALALNLGFSTKTAWKDLSSTVQQHILYGFGHEVVISGKNRFGRERSYSTGFEGVVTSIKRRHEQTESDWSRQKYESYMREVDCPACSGSRLKPESLAVSIGGLSIAQVSNLPVDECFKFFKELNFTANEALVADRILKEVCERLAFLLDVGLNYLCLSRGAATLSGGEAQRIRLATQIGSALVGVLYVLDEPSIGLHQRDNLRLVNTLIKLRDLGNTLIVVEHDEDTIRAADWVVDFGPGAGEGGGEVVVSGGLEMLLESERSVTGAYLSGRRKIKIPEVRRAIKPGFFVEVQGATENNLKNIDVVFPLGVLTAVTGVSGSGKSTLVNDILYSKLANDLNGATLVPGRHKKILGSSLLDKIIHVDQGPIGRTPRSNPATYTGVFDKIRDLFAQTSEAKIRGYLTGRFSFNVKGGRCETCTGAGSITIEMNFLPDVYVPCSVCRGSRYNSATLEVLYKGKSISDVLHMPISEAAEFFKSVTSIARYLDTLCEVGLGYVRLGQAATTLSGGEAQRVKLATELQKRSNGRSIYILDEPTTGLHFEDISKLLLVLQRLVDTGNTVVVIEHNLDVIKSADWVIDLGPEGGAGGGSVIAFGTPEEVAGNPASFTGQFLKSVLESDR